MRWVRVNALLLSLCGVCALEQLTLSPSCMAQDGSASTSAQRFVPMRRRVFNKKQRSAQPQTNSTDVSVADVPPEVAEAARSLGLLPAQPSGAQSQEPALQSQSLATPAIQVQRPAAMPQAQPPAPTPESNSEAETPDIPPASEQLPPPVPPTVTYENGLLSISSENSTLASILERVRQCLGALVSVPLAAQGERVAVSLGPASPREVVAALLSGSAFNYLIVGSVEEPDSIQRLVLTKRQNTRKASAASSSANVPANIEPSHMDKALDEQSATLTEQPENTPHP